MMENLLWKLFVNKFWKAKVLTNTAQNLPGLNLKILPDILENNCYEFH